MHELSLLILDLFFVRVAREVDIFALARLLGRRARIFAILFGRVERQLLIELVEARNILVIFDVRDKWRLGVTQVFPVDTTEEWVRFDFSDAVGAKAIVHVAHESLQDVSCLW